MNDLAQRMTRAADEMQRILRLLEKPADLLPEERARLVTLFQALLDNLRTEAWKLDAVRSKGSSKNNPLYERVFQMVDRSLEAKDTPPPSPPPDKRASKAPVPGRPGPSLRQSRKRGRVARVHTIHFACSRNQPVMRPFPWG